MNRIAFFVQHMLCGGVENSLIALSKVLYREGYEVTIYMISKTGEFIDRIPDGVVYKSIPLPKSIERILPVGGTKLTVKKNLKGHHYIRAAINLKNHIFGKSKFAELNVNFNSIPILNEEYDIAVNFHMHSPFLVRYLSEKVQANRKLTWIHNDFYTTKYDIKALKGYLECCEGFYAVSEKLKDEFISILPEYKEKTDIIYNIVPIDEIIERANEEDTPEYNNVSENNLIFLSVGRLEYQKGYDLAVRVCKKLVEKELKFKWFILGDGSERRKIEKEIENQELQNTMFILGIKMNPYPYFKNCDIYIQTSRHEGYVTTVTEAKVFNRPIICTDVSGAREQIEDGVTGFVVDFNIDEIVEKIYLLSKDNSLRNSFIKNTLSRNEVGEIKDCIKPFLN